MINLVLLSLFCQVEEPAWIKLPKVREPDQALGTVLSDIDSHLHEGHIYRDEDVVTWGHETTHGINSVIRNRHHKGRRVNGFYCLEDRCIVITEPPTTIKTVATKVPPSLRGQVFQLYLQSQAESDWNNHPLYILDEWVSYTNGSAIRKDLGIKSRSETVLYMTEFNVYALVLAKVVHTKEKYKDKQFKPFIRWNIERAMSIYSKESAATKYLTKFRKNEDAEELRSFAFDYFGEEWCQKVLQLKKPNEENITSRKTDDHPVRTTSNP